MKLNLKQGMWLILIGLIISITIIHFRTAIDISGKKDVKQTQIENTNLMQIENDSILKAIFTTTKDSSQSIKSNEKKKLSYLIKIDSGNNIANKDLLNRKTRILSKKANLKIYNTLNNSNIKKRLSRHFSYIITANNEYINSYGMWRLYRKTDNILRLKITTKKQEKWSMLKNLKTLA